MPQPVNAAMALVLHRVHGIHAPSRTRPQTAQPHNAAPSLSPDAGGRATPTVLTMPARSQHQLCGAAKSSCEAASESAQKPSARARCLNAVRCLESVESSAGRPANHLRTIHLQSQRVVYPACGRWQAKTALTSCRVRPPGGPARAANQPVRMMSYLHPQHGKQKSTCWRVTCSLQCQPQSASVPQSLWELKQQWLLRRCPAPGTRSLTTF